MDAFEMTLPAGPTAATTARCEVTRRLSQRVPGRALEDVRLLLTELVTNALRHSAVTPEDEIGVRAQVDNGTVRIEVHDPGNNGEVEQRPPGARGGGYGLFLVDQLTSRWGVERRDGTTVWAELASGAGR
jgi:anti-sigma regulatory factor (Ser/Thr protein kinase)